MFPFKVQLKTLRDFPTTGIKSRKILATLPVFGHFPILSWLYPIHLQDIEVQRYVNNLKNTKYHTTGQVKMTTSNYNRIAFLCLSSVIFRLDNVR